MNVERVSVDRGLYALALTDAIAWQASILESHDPPYDLAAPGCCKPGNRCEQYRKEAHLLARYTAAQNRLRRSSLLRIRREAAARQSGRAKVSA